MIFFLFQNQTKTILIDRICQNIHRAQTKTAKRDFLNGLSRSEATDLIDVVNDVESQTTPNQSEPSSSSSSSIGTDHQQAPPAVGSKINKLSSSAKNVAPPSSVSSTKTANASPQREESKFFLLHNLIKIIDGNFFGNGYEQQASMDFNNSTEEEKTKDSEFHQHIKTLGALVKSANPQLAIKEYKDKNPKFRERFDPFCEFAAEVLMHSNIKEYPPKPSESKKRKIF